MHEFNGLGVIGVTKSKNCMWTGDIHGTYEFIGFRTPNMSHTPECPGHGVLPFPLGSYVGLALYT